MNIKNYKPEEALKIILAAAEDYHNVLDGKNYMIVYYENKELKCKLLSFNGANFCHLTGSKTKVTPTQYDRLIKAKVQEILDNIPLKQQINNKPKR